MAIFLLVRHGENDYVKKGRLAGRLPNVHLNDHGKKQAQSLAEKLSSAPIKAIYSSPLERALETAQPIARALNNMEIVERPGLIEMDFGEWQDQKLKALARSKLWKLVQGAPSRMQFPGGETFASAQLRISQELVDISKLHGNSDLVLCVSHSDVIKLAVAFFIGMPLDAFQRLQISPASLTVLHVGEGHGRLMSLNYEISFTFPQK
jgi:probable phosphoglycerate mutase